MALQQPPSARILKSLLAPPTPTPVVQGTAANCLVVSPRNAALCSRCEPGFALSKAGAWCVPFCEGRRQRRAGGSVSRMLDSLGLLWSVACLDSS